MKWATIDGHYWVEIQIDINKKLDQMEMYSSKFDKQKNMNLEYILSLAGVSLRGKDMLMRDLDKMEEDE